ncbi:uncharacterized protein LOC116250624 [Nymphaea colorata]|nr:uncharacterized protein LOC116250624 [Nymphaea colorata]
MVYAYTPTYYSSFQDTIASICKTILPFSLKSSSTKRLASQSYEQSIAKQQTENLKWQQDMYHKMLNMMGLHKEGMLPESQLSSFRSNLLDTLIASPANQEAPQLIRDKLVFLQELFYAKCISEEEYHASKRPLLLRLAVQGEEINCRDVIVSSAQQLNFDDESEWSVVELRDECSIDRDNSKSKPKHRSPMKQLKGAMSKITSFSSGQKSGKNRGKAGPNLPNGSFKDNRSSDAQSPILMPECSPPSPSLANETASSKQGKKSWGLKMWRKRGLEDDSTTPYLPPGERSDDIVSTGTGPCALASKPIGEGPDTKLIKKKIHSDGSASDFFIDKVLGENIKKELSRIQSELCTKNPNHNFSNEQIEAISTRLPVDKSDLKKFFPKSWCDSYGDVVLDVVKKEFKDHVSEMESLRKEATKENQVDCKKWNAFRENDENCSPNVMACSYDNPFCVKESYENPFCKKESSPAVAATNACEAKEWYTNNPFFDEEHVHNKFGEQSALGHWNKQNSTSTSLFV